MSAEPFASRPSPQFNFNLRDLRTLRVPSDLPTSMSSCSYQMRFVLEKVILRLRHRRQRCHRCLDQGRLLHGWHGATEGFEGWSVVDGSPSGETQGGNGHVRAQGDEICSLQIIEVETARTFHFWREGSQGRYFSFWGGKVLEEL